MKRQHILTLILASFFIIVAFSGVGVYAAVSGDEVCGGTSVKYDASGKIISGECGITDITKIFKGIFSNIIAIGLPLLVVFIMSRFVIAWYQLQRGNAAAYKEAIEKVGQAILGFVIIVALVGGILISMLKFLGVQDFPLKLLEKISSTFVTHAYAEQQLPNPLGVTNLYDFILSVLNLIMKFFIYPGLIAMWVWSGFNYVLAQGAPDKLAKTHKLLMWAVISTLVVFVTQGFLTAVRGSVQKIVPSSSIYSPAKTLSVERIINFRQ